LYRRPFTGRSARRYAGLERPGFGDLDERLCEAWRPDLASARRVVDIGSGPGTVGCALRAAFPGLAVLEVEPSRDFVVRAVPRVRALAEALPFATASMDAAVSVSSIRHVADRGRTLAELRRVVRPGGVAFVVELDPEAPPRRIQAHADRLGSRVLRTVFSPLVVRTAPPARVIEAAARAAGWREIARRDDPVQPVYELRLA
jgi:ubiquinone/menaquinone biosynthesis C-methylase UbiE